MVMPSVPRTGCCDAAHREPRPPTAQPHARRYADGVRNDGPYRGKRLFDLTVLLLVAMPAASVGVVCAAAVALSSRGGVFFRQERVGMDGRPFRVWKFRTMVAGDNPIFPDASRITAVGAVLRRLSL